jgi:peptidoglycan/xylan/chitin deacetylase (PgdA/CDA1 family)
MRLYASLFAAGPQKPLLSMSRSFTRRAFSASAAGGILSTAAALAQPPAQPSAQPSVQLAARQAQIAITLDLEMSRNFPTWEATHWDYEKGNLNRETIAYAIEAARRVKERGGRIHFFLLGRTLEQEDVGWLKQFVADGHPIGNHTYDHVNVRATRPEDIQFRFQRSPWLIAGRDPVETIRENIRLTTTAMQSRLGIRPNGFRTPGGFASGLSDRPDLQRMLLDLGFSWVSSKYPGHVIRAAGEEPTEAAIRAAVAAQAAAQPFRYESGLVEVPMSPISDIGAFRTGRWKLAWFLRAIRAAAGWAIEQRSTFDFLGHPSCLYVTDPEFKTIDVLCDLVERAGNKATLANLQTLSQRAG